MEHLAWHAVHAAAPAEDRKAPSHILEGIAQRSPWHAPYAQRPPPLPQAASNAAAPGEGEAVPDAPPREEPPLTEADQGDGGAAHHRSVPAGLAVVPLWAPLGAGSPVPLAPVPPGDLAARADPAEPLPVRDS